MEWLLSFLFVVAVAVVNVVITKIVVMVVVCTAIVVVADVMFRWLFLSTMVVVGTRCCSVYVVFLVVDVAFAVITLAQLTFQQQPSPMVHGKKHCNTSSGKPD